MAGHGRVLVMHEAVFWLGFGGGWLLFAGPVYQAVLELQEEEEARDRMRRLLDGLDPPPTVSNWWWLLPPVAIVLRSRRRGDYQRTVVATMSPDDLEVITHYIAVARGWMLVAAGAWLIALKETYELVEHHEWSLVVYWVLVAVVTAFVVGSAGASVTRPERPLTTTPAAAPRPGG
jgi:hypothetical protein